MDYRSLREALHLTQAQFAELAGVSQPAVASYENGRRHPSGSVHGLYEVIEQATTIPARQVDLGRGRTATVPATRWSSFLPVNAKVKLPIHLDWSPRQDATWDLSHLQTRVAFYSLVLTEGSVVDICVYLNPTEIGHLAGRMRSVRSVAAAVDALVPVPA